MLTKSLFLLLFSFLFSACNRGSTLQPYTLDEKRTSTCQDEIEKTISSLIHARNLSISKDVFSKTSSLHLTNKKDSILRKSPIYNDLRGRKTLMMYKENSNLYIGLINEKKEILKSKKLQQCLAKN